MRQFKKGTRKKVKRGSALVAVLMFIAVFALAIGGTLSFVEYQTRSTHRSRVAANSLDGARATMDSFANNVLHIATVKPPQQTGGQVTSLSDVIHSVQPNAPYGMELMEHDGRPLAYVKDRGPNDWEFREITDPSHQWYGYTIAELDYELIAAVMEDSNVAKDLLNYTGNAVRQRVTLRYIPLYQYAIFYEQDLELHPGPQMDVTGRVHSNTHMYLSSVNSLQFHDKVTAAGNIYRMVDTGQTGDVEFRVPNGSGGYTWEDMRNPPAPNNGDNWFDHRDEEVWFDEALDRYQGQVLDSAHGISAVRPPLPTGAGMIDLIQRIQADDTPELRAVKFESLANIIISGDPGNPSTWNAYAQSIDEDGERTLTPISRTLWEDGVSAGEFYDGHQQTIVRTLDVDIAALRAAGLFDDVLDFSAPSATNTIAGNGVIYVSTTPGELDSYSLASRNQDPVWIRGADGRIVFDSDGNGTYESGQGGWFTPQNNLSDARRSYMPAVRVKNAATLPRNDAGGFALYTDRPLYTAGDINTGSNRAAAVFAGDAVTVTAYEQWLASYNAGSHSTPDSLGSFPDGSSPVDEDGDPISSGNLARDSVRPNDGKGHTSWEGDRWDASSYYWDGNVSNQDYYRTGSTSTTNIRNKMDARNTETNCIFLMGNPRAVYDPDDPERQETLFDSGGAHNVMQYLEDWGGKTHDFDGSMIVLFESQIATSKYRNNSNKIYYKPPNRLYDWDDRLQTTIPPPGMPSFIEIKKWEMEPVSIEYAIENLPVAETEGGE